MRADDRKFEALILYLARASEQDPRYGKTKLNKLLFYTDFTAYEERMEPVTGHRYKKLPYGPVPARIDETLASMERRGLIRLETQDFHGKDQIRVIALADPPPGALPPEDEAVARRIVERLWLHTGKEVSDLSHDFLGWRVARPGEPIPYPMALVTTSEWTAEDDAHEEAVLSRRRR